MGNEYLAIFVSDSKIISGTVFEVADICDSDAVPVDPYAGHHSYICPPVAIVRGAKKEERNQHKESQCRKHKIHA